MIWLKIFLFTMLTSGISYFHGKYWFLSGKKREGWMVLIWMGIAWMTGILFLLGYRLPQPTEPLFPNWK